MEGSDGHSAPLEWQPKPRLHSEWSVCCHLLAPVGLSQIYSDGLQSQSRNSGRSIPTSPKIIIIITMNPQRLSWPWLYILRRVGNRWKALEGRAEKQDSSGVKLSAKPLCGEETKLLGWSRASPFCIIYFLLLWEKKTGKHDLVERAFGLAYNIMS